MFDKLSAELREQREKAGISLQQLANKTRIDLKFLEAIDQGNFAFLPELYVKAFIKQYAKTVGLDETLILKKYDAAKGGKEYDPNKPAEETVGDQSKIEVETSEKPITAPGPKPATVFENPLEHKPGEQSKTKKQNLIWMIAGSIAVLTVILIFVFVSHKSNEIIVEETPIEDVVGQQNQRYQESDNEKSQSVESSVKASTDSLHLTFFAKETSWVYLILDDKTTKEFTLSPNTEISVTALNNFQGTIGNSGGITMELDNHPVEFSGRSGSVKYFKLDKSGLVYLNTPPKIENP
jgi:cytoskeletal protein RodZ